MTGSYMLKQLTPQAISLGELPSYWGLGYRYWSFLMLPVSPPVSQVFALSCRVFIRYISSCFLKKSSRKLGN